MVLAEVGGARPNEARVRVLPFFSSPWSVGLGEVANRGVGMGDLGLGTQ
jgi:hypothetical protein